MDVLDMLYESSTVEQIMGVAAPLGNRLQKSAARRGLPVETTGLTAAKLPDDVQLIIAAHSHDFISKATRDRTEFGAIGYHPSLLPLHRGRDAIKWTIRDRDKVAGGTVFWLNDVVDGGPIAKQDYCLVNPLYSAWDLWTKELAPMGIRLLEETLEDLFNGVMYRVTQNPDLATWEPKLDPPRLYRPDLLEIGPGWEDLEVRTSRG